MCADWLWHEAYLLKRWCIVGLPLIFVGKNVPRGVELKVLSEPGDEFEGLFVFNIAEFDRFDVSGFVKEPLLNPPLPEDPEIAENYFHDRFVFFKALCRQHDLNAHHREKVDMVIGVGLQFRGQPLINQELE